ACPALDKRPFKEMGFTLSKTWAKDLGAGLFIAALTMSLMTLVMWQFGYLQINISPDAEMSSEFIRSVAGILVLMIAVSVWEEIYFRGYLLRNLQEAFTPKNSQLIYPMIAAVLVSSIIFGFAHTSNPNSSILSFINITAAGIVLAYPYIYTRSMAISVGLHLSWNYFQGVIYGMPVSGLVLETSFFQSTIADPQILTGGQFGPEGGAIGFSGLLVMALLCSIYLHKIREVK
ncbi:MAG: CPBP family intramembrane metalloprotease, partial [Balneolaceae bacterium]|nr:CPBP family intramembrane metalloprotease [Balneolaceae bacterium]